MSLWKIAWRSIQQRRLASVLTGISMALGVALVVAVLVVHNVISAHFLRSAQGYHLIVGAKGGTLQLVPSRCKNTLRAVFRTGKTNSFRPSQPAGQRRHFCYRFGPKKMDELRSLWPTWRVAWAATISPESLGAVVARDRRH